jgi:parallel beta-helix repeat protein
VKAIALVTLAMAVLVNAGAGTASAAVLRVSQSGYWGAEPAATTVQSAIDAAATGDEVWVAEGTYLENCVLKDGVSLFGGFGSTETSRSERDWNAHRTILDGGGALGSVIYVPYSASAATIDGFTIQNGTGTKYSWLRSVEGGGILGLQYSNLTIANNVFRNNTAVYGGGLSIKEFSTVAIYNNIFYGNSATQSGGGIALTNSHGTVANNTIAGNSSGILSWNSDAALVNNIITGSSGGGVYILHNADIPFPYFDYNDLFGNTAYDYALANFGTIPAAPHDLSVDPLYADAANADFRLLPSSSCIDAGDSGVIAPLTDIDMEGDPRIMYGAADIGADEWVDRVAPVVLSTNPADGSSTIGLTSSVFVTFDEQISAGSAFGQIAITYVKNKKEKEKYTVPAVKSISGNVLTITPSSDYPDSTLVTVTLPAQGLTDGTGNPSAPYSFKFTTVCR